MEKGHLPHCHIKASNIPNTLTWYWPGFNTDGFKSNTIYFLWFEFWLWKYGCKSYSGYKMHQLCFNGFQRNAKKLGFVSSYRKYLNAWICEQYKIKYHSFLWLTPILLCWSFYKHENKIKKTRWHTTQG